MASPLTDLKGQIKPVYHLKLRVLFSSGGSFYPLEMAGTASRNCLNQALCGNRAGRGLEVFLPRKTVIAIFVTRDDMW